MTRPPISIRGLMGIIPVGAVLFALARLERGIVFSGLEDWVDFARTRR